MVSTSGKGPLMIPEVLTESLPWLWSKSWTPLETCYFSKFRPTVNDFLSNFSSSVSG